MNHKNSKMKYLMSYGHFCADFTQGALSAVLPFLIASYSYNYATAAILVMISNLIGSVIQPVFGHMADKIDRPHLMTLGVILAGGGMCMVGFLTSYAVNPSPCQGQWVYDLVDFKPAKDIFQL